MRHPVSSTGYLTGASLLPVRLNTVAGIWHRFTELKQNKDPLEKGDGESKRMRPTSSGGKENMRKIALQEEKNNRNVEGLDPDSVLGTAANTANTMSHLQQKEGKRKESDLYRHQAEEGDTQDGRLSLTRAENLSSGWIYK